MKAKLALISLLIGSTLFMVAQSNEQKLFVFKDGRVTQSISLSEIDSLTFVNNNIVEDIDGNKYNFATVGGIDFMLENLRVTRYNDGTPIPNAIWNGSTPRYVQTGTEGYHYNYYVVETGKLCPTGWYVPVEENLRHIFNVATGKTNPSAAEILASYLNIKKYGYYEPQGTSIVAPNGYNGFWRLDGFTTTNNGGHVYHNQNDTNFTFGNVLKGYLISVRCIRDRRP